MGEKKKDIIKMKVNETFTVLSSKKQNEYIGIVDQDTTCVSSERDS